MALTYDDIQNRNAKLQGEYGTLKSNRANLLSAIGATAPKVSSYGGMVPSVNFAPGQEAARTDYQSQLADNDKAMGDFTARAQQLTKDANTFTDSTRAKLYAANTGVPLKYQNSAPSASASTGAAAGATAPAGGQPTNTGFVSGRVTRGSADPMFANVQSGVFGSNEGGAGRPAAPSAATSKDVRNDDGSVLVGGDPRNRVMADGTKVTLSPDGKTLTAIGSGSGGAAPYVNTPAEAIYNSYPQQQSVGYSIGGAGTIGGPQDPNKKYLSDLNSTIDRLSINPNMRSKRDMLVQALAIRNGFLNQQNQIASTEGIAAQSRAAELARTGMTEAGADRRNTATLQNQMAVEGLRQNGDTYRTLLGAMPRPQYTVDSNGNYVQINGATSTPVLGNDGSPLKLPKNNDASNDMLKARMSGVVEAMKGANATLGDMNASDEAKASARQTLTQAYSLIGLSAGGGAVPVAKPTQAEATAEAQRRIKENPSGRDYYIKAMRDAGYTVSGL